MEDLPSNEFEAKIYLNDKDSLDSKVLKKSYCVKFINEDKNNFKIKACDDDETFFYHFQMSHWANRKEKDFIYQINNFELLLETVKVAVEKKRVTLTKDYDNLKLTLHYTIIFKENKLSFDLHLQQSNEEEKELIGKYYEDSDALLETKDNVDYRAEIVEYNKNFEDYGDRNIIRLTVRNTGTCAWEKGIASLQCVPEFSSLLCEEYFFEDDIIAGDEAKIELEFLKHGKDNYDPPYFTCLHLHIHPQNFAPMLVLDFNDAFITQKKEINLPRKDEIDFKKNEINKEKENKNKINIINEEEDNKNTINDEEENENKISIIYEEKDNKKKTNKINEEKNNKNKINIINEVKDNKNKINIINEEKGNKNKINIINEEKDSKNKIIKNDIKEKKESENKKNDKPKKKAEKEIPQNKDIDEDEEEKLKKMTPIQRRIYLLNKKEKDRIKKEEEAKGTKGWQKNFKK